MFIALLSGCTLFEWIDEKISLKSFIFVSIKSMLSKARKEWIKSYDLNEHSVLKWNQIESQIEYYNVHHIRFNKSFAFNLLSPTLTVPSPLCKDADSADSINLFAYLHIDNNECISLSGQSAIVSLLNDHNPSEGILISYTSTETSSICGYHGKRLNLRFICDNEAIVDILNTNLDDYFCFNAQCILII